MSHNDDKGWIERIDEATRNPTLLGLSAAGMGAFVLFSLLWDLGRSVAALVKR